MSKRKQKGGFATKKHLEQMEKEKRTRQRQLIGAAVGLVLLVVVFIVARQLFPANDTVEPAADEVSSSEERPLAALLPAQRNNYYSSYPDMIIDTEKSYEAIIETEKGDIRLRLFDDEAPLTVNNFVFLARQGFYDGITFHRVIDDFMAQGGDPTGSGTGGPGYQFADETDNGLVFDRPGLLAMANAGPNTNGSQFFITVSTPTHLNGIHTILGEVIEGAEVLDSISIVSPGQPGDVINRIDIVEE